MPVPGVELLAGAAISYVLRKVRRVGGRADAAVDEVLDRGADAVDELIAGRLGDDGALARLREQAARGAESERTVRRAVDAVADAAEDDADFAAALKELVDRLQKHEAALPGSPRSGVHAGRDVHQHAETGGVIAGDVYGPITTTSPPAAPSGSTTAEDAGDRPEEAGGGLDPTRPALPD
jgi:hypothetical protein